MNPMNQMTSMFDGVGGRIEPGCCRLSLNGRIAVKTSDGYKVYNPKTGSVTNCSNFVLDLADDMFMMVPTRVLKPGYIILINGKPVYVLENLAKNRVKVMQYEDSSIKEVIPERHVLLGRKFYGRIVSMLGDGFGVKGGGFFKNMLKLKMMGAMMSGSGDSGFGGNALPMMMLMNGGSLDGLFDGICSESEDNDDEDGDDTFTLFNDDGEDCDECDDEPAKSVKKRVKKPAKKVRK